MQKYKAIFLDRDGTVIVDKNYLKDPSQLEWIPKVKEGLLLLKKKGYLLFLITNQSGIGRGIFTEDDLIKVHSSLNTMMCNEGIGAFTQIAYCPHLPEDNCICRKPSPSMIKRMIKDYKVDIDSSWMLGDKDIDAICGKNAGIKGGIVGNSELKTWAINNDFSYFNNMLDFANNVE